MIARGPRTAAKRLSVLIVIVVACLWTVRHRAGDDRFPDLSSPTASYESLLQAISEQDRGALQEIWRIDGDEDSVEWHIEDLIEHAHSLPWFVQGWEVLYVDYERYTKHPQARVWLLAHDKKVKDMLPNAYGRGCLAFQEEDGRWQWLSMHQAFLVWEYDQSTPEKAYRSLEAASFSGSFGGIADIGAIYDAIATKLKEGVSFDQYMTLISKRRAARVPSGFPPYFYYDGLEEEMGADGKAAKVWFVTGGGRSSSHEAFVKEGNAWKWLPRDEYIWYPKTSQ